MLNSLTIGRRMAFGYAIAVVTASSIGAVAYTNIGYLVETAAWVAHTHIVLERIGKIQVLLNDAETGQRGYLLTGADRYLAPYDNALTAIHETADEIQTLTEDNPRQQKRLAELRPYIRSKLDELNETIELRRNEGFDAALAVVLTDRGKNDMDEMRRLLTAMEAEERELLTQRDADATTGAQWAVWVIVAMTVATVALIVLIALIVSRSVRVAITAAVRELNGVTSELLASTSQQSSATAETVSSVSETVSTVEELRQTSEMALEKSRIVTEVGQESVTVSQHALQSANEAVEAMRNIRDEVESIAKSILDLSEKNIQISEIVGSVNLIAEQSNLLAVNAAIEAADAGEHGKRFAVVAGEVKTLAEQSKEATAQIRNILVDIQKSSNAAVMVTENGSKRVLEGVRLIEELGEIMENLSNSIKDTIDAGQQISATSAQQATGMQQINTAMRSVEAASRQNAQGASSIGDGARRVTEVGRALSGLVER
ncbi:MAG: CHASE3 domain-containing protein [Myxococcota bacterium]